MKETLRKRIASRITIGFGIATIIGAAPYYAITAENSADKKVEETFPHITSTEQLKQAQQEVLIFDKKVHNLISSGESVLDATKTADITELRQAIRVIDDEQTVLKQRRELRQDLQEPINKRANTIFGGSVLLALAGAATWMVLRTLRGKRNNTLSSEPSNN